MNDFTKEELENIRDNIGETPFSHLYGTKEEFQRIRDKAQSMIDNYCEPICPDCGEIECFKNYKCVNIGNE